MKRILTFILALCLSVCLAACGGSGSQVPDATEPEEWNISPQYVAGRLGEFMASEEYRTMKDLYVYQLNVQYGDAVVRSLYLEGALECYLKDFDDVEHRFLLMALRGDVGTDTGMGDKLLLMYDMNSGVFYSNCSKEISAYSEKYAAIEGTLETNILNCDYDHVANFSEGDILYFGYEYVKTLTSDEVALVNDSMGLEWSEETPNSQDDQPQESEVPEETEPEIPEETEAVEMVSPEEAPEPMEGTETAQSDLTVQAICDGARATRETQYYQEIAPDATRIQIEGAVEYLLTNYGEQGLNVHILLLRAAGIDTDMYGFGGGVFVVELETGAVYSQKDLNIDNWGNLATCEDIYAGLLCCDQIWTERASNIITDEETMIWLDQATVDAVNAELENS